MQIVSTYLQTRHQPHALWIPYKNRVCLLKHILAQTILGEEEFHLWLANPNLKINKIPKP